MRGRSRSDDSMKRRTSPSISPQAGSPLAPELAALFYVGQPAHTLNDLELGTTISLLLLFIAALSYALYSLYLPYLSFSTTGILFFVFLNPQHQIHPKRHRRKWRSVVHAMEKCQQRWCSQSLPCSSVLPSRRSSILHIVNRCIGREAALMVFVRFAVVCCGTSLGLDGSPYFFASGLLDRHPSSADDRDRRLGSSDALATGGEFSSLWIVGLTLATLLAAAQVVFGAELFILLHSCLFVFGVVAVQVLPPEDFVATFLPLWKVVVIVFFGCGLVRGLVSDGVYVSRAFIPSRRESAGLVEPFGSQANSTLTPPSLVSFAQRHISDVVAQVVAGLYSSLMQELASTFSDTNVTDVVREVLQDVFPPEDINEDHSSLSNNGINCTKPREGWWRVLLNPIVSQLDSWQQTCTTQIDKLLMQLKQTAVVEQLVGLRTELSMSGADWIGLLVVIAVKSFPLVLTIARGVGRLLDTASRVREFLKALTLMVFLMRAVTPTLLHQLLARVLRLTHGESAARRVHYIERYIIQSFLFYLDSIGRQAWYHGFVVCTAFHLCGLPGPFLCGSLAALLSVAPAFPNLLRVSYLSLGAVLASRWDAHGVARCLLHPSVPILTIAAIMERHDSWLLLSAGGGCYARQAALVARHPSFILARRLPPFPRQNKLLGIAVVLGVHAFGLCGIVLGPLSCAMAEMLFFNWDVV